MNAFPIHNGISLTELKAPWDSHWILWFKQNVNTRTLYKRFGTWIPYTCIIIQYMFISNSGHLTLISLVLIHLTWRESIVITINRWVNIFSRAIMAFILTSCKIWSFKMTTSVYQINVLQYERNVPFQTINRLFIWKMCCTWRLVVWHGDKRHDKFKIFADIYRTWLGKLAFNTFPPSREIEDIFCSHLSPNSNSPLIIPDWQNNKCYLLH